MHFHKQVSKFFAYFYMENVTGFKIILNLPTVSKYIYSGSKGPAKWWWYTCDDGKW